MPGIQEFFKRPTCSFVANKLVRFCKQLLWRQQDSIKTGSCQLVQFSRGEFTDLKRTRSSQEWASWHLILTVTALLKGKIMLKLIFPKIMRLNVAFNLWCPRLFCISRFFMLVLWIWFFLFCSASISLHFVFWANQSNHCSTLPQDPRLRIQQFVSKIQLWLLTHTILHNTEIVTFDVYPLWIHSTMFRFFASSDLLHRSVWILAWTGCPTNTAQCLISYSIKTTKNYSAEVNLPNSEWAEFVCNIDCTGCFKFIFWKC